eukprot:CAMPEP_0201122890 /NCGR_PEP_ID=MMETSP0850-20130426/6413_1 /ASSEMBLY_ACC=CAM_ASM_000622 /TAXON_ID=183588 /ORGANISM="Pseudo-nitzschia fraudulenta, Strain WWA7" /LENGTH=551 /DNA_ID=CAMNT_0047389677 /DNA_START=54 /DNA_END=1709 /DNA_ORIENTATION=+
MFSFVGIPSVNERTPFLPANSSGSDRPLLDPALARKEHPSSRPTAAAATSAVGFLLLVAFGGIGLSATAGQYDIGPGAVAAMMNSIGGAGAAAGSIHEENHYAKSQPEPNEERPLPQLPPMDAAMDFDRFLYLHGKRYDRCDDESKRGVGVDESEGVNDKKCEYEIRRSIFESNVEKILSHNQHKDKHGWTMGINQFADLLPEEMPRGFDKGAPHGSRAHEIFSGTSSHSFSSLLESRAFSSLSNHRGRRLRTTDLPKSVDWRRDPEYSVTTPIKDQGHCGSCWAFAATAALETHVALATEGDLFVLSPQALVSCAPNDNHCGGSGGCDGSTGEMAYDYVHKHGMVTEWQYGYTSYHGDTGTCELEDVPEFGYRGRSNRNAGMVEGAKVAVDGFSSLPTNSYDHLMYAVANLGPVVVSVAANYWYFYGGGIFDDSHLGNNYDINHAVVLEGYGTDEETGEDYWLVRNSYGVQWGEHGYIRLKRTDPGPLPESYSPGSPIPDGCKIDNTPADGVSCLGPNANDTIPDQLTCGTSGILYANVVPVGAHVLKRN